MKQVTITCGDYEQQCLPFIDKNTFVYCIWSHHIDFIQNRKFHFTFWKNFDDNEQYRLGKFIDKLNKIKAKVILSNSYPTNTDVHFILTNVK